MITTAKVAFRNSCGSSIAERPLSRARRQSEEGDGEDRTAGTVQGGPHAVAGSNGTELGVRDVLHTSMPLPAPKDLSSLGDPCQFMQTLH